ncbi:MAG: ImmA/IrrE family metallo-endopeptidase [Pseudomonadales bacterium]
MKLEPIPINKEILAWARDRAGFSIEEASQSIHEKYPSWESPGENLPTYPQLEKVSDKFKIPLAVFFFPSIPDIPDTEESFRTLPGAEFKELPRQLKLLVRKAKALQINLEELEGNANSQGRKIVQEFQKAEHLSVELLAQKAREYIGVSLEQQNSWKNSDEALKSWRAALLDVGVFVFKDAFQEPDYSGFCLWDVDYPLIYVNNSNPENRQIFTLFHELAHLLFETSGLDGLGEDVIARLPEGARQVETSCNRFAAEFLVPTENFEDLVTGLPFNRDGATELASYFNVSREVIYRKFLDRGWIEKTEYISATTEWNQSAFAQRQAGNGGNYYRTQIAYLGKDYIELAFQRYYQQRISEIQLADYLGIKGKNISTFESYMDRVR